MSLSRVNTSLLRSALSNEKRETRRIVLSTMRNMKYSNKKLQPSVNLYTKERYPDKDFIDVKISKMKTPLLINSYLNELFDRIQQ